MATHESTSHAMKAVLPSGPFGFGDLPAIALRSRKASLMFLRVSSETGGIFLPASLSECLAFRSSLQGPRFARPSAMARFAESDLRCRSSSGISLFRFAS